MTGDAYRDGRVHVLEAQCATCVFRPGNLMKLEPGRLANLVAENVDAESALTCHSTLYREDGVRNAICRAFFDRHRTLPLKLAEALDLIEWDPVPA